jgi:hypothetical protein
MNFIPNGLEKKQGNICTKNYFILKAMEKENCVLSEA